MKAKALIIVSIIIALATITMAWISSSARFDIEIPWFILSLPTTMWAFVLVLNYGILESKKKDSEKK